MKPRILLVDDEANVLQAYTRVLRNRFALDTADGGAQALDQLENRGPYAVIVSDMRMPGMDGVELLSQTRERFPDTVRIMLTGNADQQTATEAVNQGAIFRFLNKPCDSELLASTLDQAIRQHELITAEKSLLENTLKGTIRMLVELLSCLDPISFGRAQAMAAHAEAIAKEMGMENPWVLGIAGVLYAMEFVADKIPFVTPIWDGIHTFIRPLGGALLAVGATGQMNPMVHVIMALCDLQDTEARTATARRSRASAGGRKAPCRGYPGSANR